MLLIGGFQIFEVEGFCDAEERFYVSLFPRLVELLEPGKDNVSRLIGYRAYASDGRIAQFFGIETNQIDNIPADMVGWELTNEFLITKAADVQDCVPIKWLWKNESAALVGEFTSSPFEGLDIDSQDIQWRMTANAPICVEGIEDGDAVELVEHRASWSGDFEKMKRWLETELGDIATNITHYGSTAIPNMPAKPIIDILVEVSSYDAAVEILITLFNKSDFEYWWYGDHLIFIKRNKPFGKRSHHLHIAPPAHRLWEGVAFRDHLIANRKIACDYCELKQYLSRKHKNDREAYTKAKAGFIRENSP